MSETKQQVTAETVEVEMTGEDMRRCAQGFADAINNAQAEEGFDIDQVITVMLHVIGSTLAQRGVVLPMDAPLPLRVTLPALADGYDMTREHIAKKAREAQQGRGRGQPH